MGKMIKPLIKTCEHNCAAYILFNITALLAMVMVTEVAVVCGENNVHITAYQLSGVIPQAFMLACGPFLNYITYLEPIPKHWKIVKLIIIGVLFAVSITMTETYGLQLLAAKYGSAKSEMLLLPIFFYTNLVIGIMNQFGILEWRKLRNDEE